MFISFSQIFIATSVPKYDCEGAEKTLCDFQFHINERFAYEYDFFGKEAMTENLVKQLSAAA